MVGGSLRVHMILPPIVCTIHNWKNVAVVCYIDVPYNAGFTVVQYNNLKKYYSIEVVTTSHKNIVD
jgi:hypothetical protein